jgi:hypothetical protein
MFCVSTHKTDRVLIVYEDHYNLIGEIVFSLLGELQYAWVSDNIVIFRVDRKVGDEIGEKGKIYRIDFLDKLKEIGNADLSMSDYELAKQFGIKKDANHIIVYDIKIGI